MLVLRTVVLGLVAALLVGPGPDSAGAMSSVAPVTVDDVIVMTPLMYVDADVLANDHDPDGGNLQVCRFDSPADVALRLRIVSRSGIPGENGIIKPGSTRIDVSPEEGFHAGDYSIPYYACDRSHLTPATLTLQVRDFTAQAVAGQPRVVRFTNPLDQAALVYWAPPGAEDISGSQHLEAGQSRDVDVHGGKVQWVASLAATEGEGDDLVPIAYGTIRADGLPRPSVPPSIANPHVRASDDLVPPTTAPDHVTLEYYDSVALDVLANDSDDRPEDLSVCRADVSRKIAVASGEALSVMVHPWWSDAGVTAGGGTHFLEVNANAARAGTFELRYYACDRRNLTRGTVTVIVRRFPDPVVKKVPGKAGTISVRNRGYRTLTFSYSRWGTADRGGEVRVPPDETRRVHVPYDRLYWFADTKVGPLANGGIQDVQQDG